jgi:hypothetical protein
MYVPKPYTGNTERYIEEELREISRELSIQKLLYLAESNAPPSRLINGMIALADGTNWQPDGIGGGVFCYYGGTWNKLG